MNDIEYCKHLKPIFYWMKINGIFPFPFLGEGSTLSVIYGILSIVAYLLILVFAYMPFLEIVFKLFIKFNFLRFIYALMAMGMRIYILTYPFITWNKGGQIREHWNNWKTFQVKFEQFLHISLSSSLKLTIWKNTVIAMSIHAGISLLAVFLLREWLDISIARSIESSVLLNIIIYWYANCAFTKSTAEELVNFLINENNQDNNSQRVLQITNLWILLCNLNEQFNRLHSKLFFIYIVFFIASGIINSYIIVFYFLGTLGEPHQWLWVLSFVVFVVIILIICEPSHSILEVDSKMKDVILNRNMTNMNAEMLFEVKTFLGAIRKKKLQMNLDGYMFLDRSLIPAIIGTGINFLIILRQFNTNADDLGSSTNIK